MTKRDLFLTIYCCSWASISIILLTVNKFITHWMTDADFVLLCNMIFMLITASFVLIKPVGKFVDKHIIDKLP